MQRNSGHIVSWATILVSLILVAAGWMGAAHAARPAPGSAGGPGGQPVITDPYHHLSGVVAVPIEQMRGPANPPGGWAGGLTPPIFGPNVDASLNNAADQNETTIAINPEDDQRVIASANDYRAGLRPYVYLSTSGGTAWTNYQVPGTTALNYGDPAMTFGTGGYAYFGYLGYQSICSPLGGMYVSRSTDAGATFSPPLQLAQNSNNGAIAVLQDKEYVAVDNHPSSPYFGNVYEGWTKFVFTAGASCGAASSQIAAPVVFSRSTDHGLTWSMPITASQPISANNQGTVPVVGLNGEVYLYYLGAQTQSQLNYDTVLFSRSTDGGQTFPFFTHIASIVDLPSPLPPTNFRNNPFGAMAADQQMPGYLYAVWADYRSGDADILLARSTDNGTTWGPYQRVNDDPLGNDKDQFFPWIATSPDGRVHVGWFDRREDPQNRAYKEYYADSLDHGASFEANVAVSTAPSNPGNSGFIGDYSGIAATNDLVLPIWTDIRSGSNQNAYTARGVFGPALTPSPVPPTATATATATEIATVTNTATASPTPPATATATATASPTVCLRQFNDVPPGSTFYDYIRCLACRGIVGGYPCGGPGEPCPGAYFRPNNNVTRGQVSKIVAESAQFSDPVPSTQQTFEDVPPGSTFWLWIERLSVRGIVAGYPCGGPFEPCIAPDSRPYFRPNNNVTRGQLSKITSGAAGWTETPTGQTFEDVPPGSTFYLWIERMAARGIIAGYPCGGPFEPCVAPANRPYFRPNNNATRGQMSKIAAEAFFPNCQTLARR